MRTGFHGVRRPVPVHVPGRRPRAYRAILEPLEGRSLLSGGFQQVNLVSDLASIHAKFTDANLVDPWGISFAPAGEFWIANNGSGTSTLYDRDGHPQSLVVGIPPAGGGSASGNPTGTVFNGTSSFNGDVFLFASEDGAITGWQDQNGATARVEHATPNAVYKGLAIAHAGSGDFLYAANFHAGTIDVFDGNFAPASLPGHFANPSLPAGYAPFNIQNIGDRLYVTYALQNAAKHDDVAGPGHGFVDVFDTGGHLLSHLAGGGPLNSPWGVALAPAGFGDFGGALLVGNFGDGRIDGYSPTTGAFLGQLRDRSSHPITIDGLWALAFGNGGDAGPKGTLFFTAGIDHEQHGLFGSLTAQAGGPELLDPTLRVTTVVAGLSNPTSMAFLGPDDFLILEKGSGKVKHVVNGVVAGTALALPVNNASERGLLGIALQPDFATTRGVYLYWTRSKSGKVSGDVLDVPLLGNRVDRYVWNPTAGKLAFDRNIIHLHAFQADSANLHQPPRGNHDGGVIRFGPDGKLYILIGDNGRRGQTQNLVNGPNGRGKADDPFGGPRPDDAHLTGVILRLNPDGTAPHDNPFFRVGARTGGRVGANLQKVFAYGIRNSFGMAFDPKTGQLWESENGDDAFDELNHFTAGSNGGWIQFMGPASRLAQFCQIETTFVPTRSNLPYNPADPANQVPTLQQLRYPPTRIATSVAAAMSRLFVLPGSHYTDPEFSWKYAVAPAGVGFAGSGLGPKYAGDLFVGAARTFLDGGYLYDFKFNAARTHFRFSNPKLADRVADNHDKFDGTEGGSLLIGRNFGIGTDVQTGPDGNLYVVSLSDGAVYRISRKG